MRKSGLLSLSCVGVRPIAMAAVAICLAGRGSGQMQGRVHGVIQGADGSPVAGAQAVAHSTRENTDRASTSAADGSFTIDDLKPGHYQVKATKLGFADSPVVGANLTSGENLTVNLTLGAREGFL